ELAERRDLPVGDPDVAHALAVMVDDRAAPEDQIIALRHRSALEVRLNALYFLDDFSIGLNWKASDLHGEWYRPARTCMKAALLPDRGVVKVAGDGAREFLNGLLPAH